MQHDFLNYAYARRLKRTLFSKFKKRFNFHHKGEGDKGVPLFSNLFIVEHFSLHLPKVLTLLHRHTDWHEIWFTYLLAVRSEVHR